MVTITTLTMLILEEANERRIGVLQLTPLESVTQLPQLEKIELIVTTSVAIEEAFSEDLEKEVM